MNAENTNGAIKQVANKQVAINLIPWSGGPCPVDQNSIVLVETQDQPGVLWPGEAELLRWEHSNEGTDIINYVALPIDMEPPSATASSEVEPFSPEWVAQNLEELLSAEASAPDWVAQNDAYGEMLWREGLLKGIAKRARKLGLIGEKSTPRLIELIEEIEETGARLDLERLCNARTPDFMHDIRGILEHYDRYCKWFTGGFVLRSTKKEPSAPEPEAPSLEAPSLEAPSLEAPSTATPTTPSQPSRNEATMINSICGIPILGAIYTLMPRWQRAFAGPTNNLSAMQIIARLLQSDYTLNDELMIVPAYRSVKVVHLWSNTSSRLVLIMPRNDFDRQADMYAPYEIHAKHEHVVAVYLTDVADTQRTASLMLLNANNGNDPLTPTYGLDLTLTSSGATS